MNGSPPETDVDFVATPATRTGAVLAGGESRRFGRTKALAELGGRPLIVWVTEALRTALDSPAPDSTGWPSAVVVTSDAVVARAAGLPSRPDLRPGHGPLGGLEAALDHAREQESAGALVVGCDTPLLSSDALRVVRGDGSTSAVARGGGRVHPLCGYYRIELLEEISARLDRGELSLQMFVEAAEIGTVDLEERLGTRRARRELTNVNTPAVLRELEKSLE